MTKDWSCKIDFFICIFAIAITIMECISNAGLDDEEVFKDIITQEIEPIKEDFIIHDINYEYVEEIVYANMKIENEYLKELLTNTNTQNKYL